MIDLIESLRTLQTLLAFLSGLFFAALFWSLFGEE